MSSTNINQRVELLEKQVALLMKADVPVEAVPDAKEKPAKKAKVAKKEVIAEEEKPKKKRTSGYLLYSADTREVVKTKLTTDGAKLKNQDIMTELGAMWKALSEEERTKWNDKAKGSDDETELSE
jgi:hypothetical protein